MSAVIPIFDVDGLRVGVIGMGNLSSLQGIYEAGNSLGIVPLATEETVRNYVALVRPAVDIVIAVSHLGLDEDEDAAVSEAYGSASAPGAQNEQAAVKGMDVILGGHLHITLNPPKLIPQRDDQGNPPGFNTVLVHSGAFAKYVGRLDLAVHVGDNTSTDPSMRDSHVASFTYDLIPIDARIASDGDVLNQLEPYELKLNESLDLTQTFSFVGTAGQAKILRTDPNGGDSQLGNLVTLSMRVRNRVEADFALTNSLGIRTDFEYGALTLEQMYNVFPFENSITTMFLSGSEVQEMLDFVARKSADRGCLTQAQVSGIAFDMVCGRASGCYDSTLPKTCTADQECGDPCYVFCFSDPTSATQTCRKRASPPPAGACAGAALVTNTGDIGNNPFSSACADNIYLGDGCNACVPTDATSSCCDNQNIGGIAHPCKCAPLNPYGTYKVAVNDYIAGGGSGFLVLKRNTTKYNTGIWLRDALVDYLRQGSTRCGTLVGGWNVTTVDGYRDLDSRQWDDAAGACLDAVTGVHTSIARDMCGLACIDETVEPHDGRITPILQ